MAAQNAHKIYAIIKTTTLTIELALTFLDNEGNDNNQQLNANLNESAGGEENGDESPTVESGDKKDSKNGDE